MANYLTFASADPFTIAVYNATKNWDGILEYSTDTAAWNEWDGTTAIASAEHGGEQRIYMRGSGNTVITGLYGEVFQADKTNFKITGTDIRCIGNIENLLDYETVASGEHPAMGEHCFDHLFYNCTGLIRAPELPATELARHCYLAMFEYCSDLLTIPSLPAVELPSGCYARMFGYCTGLKLSETQSDEFPNEYRIPASGIGIVDESATANPVAFMFRGTGNFEPDYDGSPEINTTYYTANKVIPATKPVAPKLDPTALLMGWQVGNRIASMRK